MLIESIKKQNAIWPERLRDIQRPPSDEMLIEYADALRDCLNDFTRHLQHEVTLTVAERCIRVRIRIDKPQEAVFPSSIEHVEEQGLPNYPRDEVEFDGKFCHLWRFPCSAYWTLPMAWLDSTEIICVVLTAKQPEQTQ